MIHIYFGDGKGKTTAAIGLGVRAAGDGWKVCMVEFLKTSPTGELDGLQSLPGFSVHRFEHPHGFLQTMTSEEKQQLTQDMEAAVSFAEQVHCDMLILDEVLDAVALGLVQEERLLTLCRDNQEVILTGHSLPEKTAAEADYITEMKKHRHPFDRGVMARKGVEY